MNRLIDELLKYNFYDYNKLNYRGSISDPLFSWWHSEDNYFDIRERSVVRLEITNTEFNPRIYKYSPVSYNKKGFYLVQHNYLNLNVYLCIADGLLIRLRDIRYVIDGFNERNIARIRKRCYVTYKRNGVGNGDSFYIIDFLQLYGSKDIRMLERVQNASQQDIETLKSNLKICENTQEDLHQQDLIEFDEKWFDKKQGQISDFIFQTNSNITLPFDRVVNIDTTKFFIRPQEQRVYCSFFHQDHEEDDLYNTLTTIENPITASPHVGQKRSTESSIDQNANDPSGYTQWKDRRRRNGKRNVRRNGTRNRNKL